MGKGHRQDTKTEKTQSDLIRKLKTVIRKMEKELSQLRRELNRRGDVSEDYRELLEETEMPIVHTKKTHPCPKCESETAEIDLGKFIILKCQECSWRARKK